MLRGLPWVGGSWVEGGLVVRRFQAWGRWLGFRRRAVAGRIERIGKNFKSQQTVLRHQDGRQAGGEFATCEEKPPVGSLSRLSARVGVDATQQSGNSGICNS